MVYVKWTFRVVVALLVLGFFHYNLPQHDVVRIVGTENRRIDFGENSIFWASPDVGTAAVSNRDVFFVQAFRQNGRPIVYRNEDTGWGWPPYFKLDSSNLQAEAQELVSTGNSPRWVVITHYGWRSEFLTIFPNAVGVRMVDGPEVRIIPWVSIVIVTLLAVALYFLRRMWMQFRERMIDPALRGAGSAVKAIDARADAASDRTRGVIGRARAWAATWRGKPRV